MEPVRRAVIDIGTNSIKLLVADVAGRDVWPLLEESKQTRLGRGFYQTRRLQPVAIATSAKAVAQFAAAARQWQAASLRVVATSAARDAVNAAELTGAIELASGLKVEIISGEQEAEWVFQGALTNPRLAQGPLLLLDVGGGSTEFIVGQGQHTGAHGVTRRTLFSNSFPIGSVRLMEQIPHSEPPKPEELRACRQWVAEFLRKEVRPKLEPAMRRERIDTPYPENGERMQLVGTGGAASILALMEARIEGYDRERIETTRLSLDRLRWHTERLWGLSLEERKKIIGLPRNRADVILTGATIYEGVMEEFGFIELRISTRGLRFAAVMDGA